MRRNFLKACCKQPDSAPFGIHSFLNPLTAFKFRFFVLLSSVHDLNSFLLFLLPRKYLEFAVELIKIPGDQVPLDQQVVHHLSLLSCKVRVSILPKTRLVQNQRLELQHISTFSRTPFTCSFYSTHGLPRLLPSTVLPRKTILTSH